MAEDHGPSIKHDERARELDIESRSDMAKDELITACERTDSTSRGSSSVGN